MYQLVPLLLTIALLLPWVGPADPGDRIAAANAADGLAEQTLIYHQAALAAVAASPGMTGPVTVGALPDHWSAVSGRILRQGQCRRDLRIRAEHRVRTGGRLGDGAPLGRLSAGRPGCIGNKLVNPFTGTALTLPCAIPNQTPVIVSQVGG